MTRYTLNPHAQPNPRFNLKANEKKAINTLYGLCLGVVADGRVEESEVLFLDIWLRENEQFLNSYPLNILKQRIDRILADGVITKDECEDLYTLLGDIVGGLPEDTGTATSLSTAMPLDDIESIEFENRHFCFTGQFIYGKRADCEDAVRERKAQTLKNVTRQLDYLVIGTLASRDWIATSHGRKIEKALQYKQKGLNILIISEERWTQFL